MADTFYFDQQRFLELYDATAREEAERARLQAVLGFDSSVLGSGRLPYRQLPQFGETSETAEYMRGLLYGGQVVGYEFLTVGSSVVSLTPHEKARYAIVLVEADPTTGAGDLPRCIRYKQLGNDDLPTVTEGMPIGHLGVFQIGLGINLFKTRIISAVAGKNHKLQVEYYA